MGSQQPRISSASDDRDSLDGRYSREVFEQDPIYSPNRMGSGGWEEGMNGMNGKKERAQQRWGNMRHAVGILLLLLTVFLWTASNFLASVSCVLCPIPNPQSPNLPSPHISLHTFFTQNPH
jgi:solute carrier family 35 protein F5